MAKNTLEVIRSNLVAAERAEEHCLHVKLEPLKDVNNINIRLQLANYKNYICYSTNYHCNFLTVRCRKIMAE